MYQLYLHIHIVLKDWEWSISVVCQSPQSTRVLLLSSASLLPASRGPPSLLLGLSVRVLYLWDLWSVKYFKDRSLNFNRTTLDQTDYSGISTSGRVYGFENAITSNNIVGTASSFSGAVDINFSDATINPNGNKVINLGTTFAQGLSDSEINKGSGEIIYLDNRPLINRNPRQKEDIKIILEF